MKVLNQNKKILICLKKKNNLGGKLLKQQKQRNQMKLIKFKQKNKLKLRTNMNLLLVHLKRM